MDLRDFPFDVLDIKLTWHGQRCIIDGRVMASAGTDYSLNAKTFSDSISAKCFSEPTFRAVIKRLKKPLDNNDNLPEWRVMSGTLRSQNDTYGVVHMSVQMYRKLDYYIVKIMIPQWLIALFSLCAFMLPELSHQLAHLATMFLSAVAFLYVAQQDLPHLPYVTALDKLAYLTIMLPVILAGVCGILARFFDGGSEVESWVCAGGMAFLYVLANCMFLIPSYRRRQQKVRAGIKYGKNTNPDGWVYAE